MSLPKGEGRALGEILVLAVMDDGWPGGRWFAYFRDETSGSVQPFEVDLHVGPGAGVTYFGYPFRRLSGDWAEVAEGPWGPSGWIERPPVRELDGILPLSWGSSIELDGASWMVIEAGPDHVVLRPEPEDRCNGELLEPVQDSLVRTMTRADLTDERGHYRFRYVVIVC